MSISPTQSSKEHHPMSEDLGTIVEQIHAGDLDDQLVQISQAIKARGARKRAEFARTLWKGDVVRFTGSLRPEHLRGLTAVVKWVNEKTVTVDMPDEPAYGRYAGVEQVRIPLNCVELTK
jgi:tRNA(Ile2) C34 agmatinyltransferase TiaS